MNPEYVDVSLARYSDLAFTSSVVVLVVALLLLSVELAYSRGRKAERRELVAAVAADSSIPGVVAEQPGRTFDERVGRTGIALVYIGIGLLLTCIVLRGLATVRVPWGNMYEFINLTCFSGLVAAAVAGPALPLST